MKRKQERAHRILEEVVTHKIVAIRAARHPDWIAVEANTPRLAGLVPRRCALGYQLGFQSGKQQYHQLAWLSLFPAPTACCGDKKPCEKSQDAKYWGEAAGFGESILSSCNLPSALCNLIKRKKPISQVCYWCGYFDWIQPIVTGIKVWDTSFPVTSFPLSYVPRNQFHGSTKQQIKAWSNPH